MRLRAAMLPRLFSDLIFHSIKPRFIILSLFHRLIMLILLECVSISLLGLLFLFLLKLSIPCYFFFDVIVLDVAVLFDLR